MLARSTYQRGTVILRHSVARELLRKEWAYVRHDERHGPNAVLSIAGMPLTTTDETQHCKFIGITGAGKTTAIGSLLQGAFARGDRAIIADPDGVYTRRFYAPSRGDIIFNPFNERSARWDIFSEIKDDYDIEDIARSLIPDTPESHDNEWRGYARTFFTDVMQSLWRIQKVGTVPGLADAGTLRQLASTGELHRLLTRAPVTELRQLLGDTASATFLHEDASKMFAGIRAVTGSAVRAFKYIARQQGEGFSVREWVRRGQAGRGGVLFLPYKAGQIEPLRATIAAWMRLGIFEAMNREEGDQRLWFVVDELGALGRIGGLSDGLTRLRKFGGRVVLGFQSIDQVQALYGRSEANTIVENCGNTLLLRCGTADRGGTSRFASQLIGEREMARDAVSRSHRGFTDLIGTRTTSRHFYTEPAVMPAEIEQLPNQVGYLRVSSRPEWLQVRVERSEAQPRRASFISALFSGRRRNADPAVEAPAAQKSAREINSIEHGGENAASPLQTDRTTVPKEVAARFYTCLHDSRTYFRHDTKTEAFRDEGLRLATRAEDAEVIGSLVQIAAARRWQVITVKGSESFRREAWLQACRLGLEVNGFEPQPEDHARLAQGKAPASEVKPAAEARKQARRHSKKQAQTSADSAKSAKGVRQKVKAPAERNRQDATPE